MQAGMIEAITPSTATNPAKRMRQCITSTTLAVGLAVAGVARYEIGLVDGVKRLAKMVTQLRKMPAIYRTLK